MKALKVIGLTLVGIILLIVILALIAPSSYHVERTTTISASKAIVFDNIVHWNKWHSWSPWAEMDPSMKLEVTGTDGEVGSVYKWVGDPELTGRGEMTNTGVKALEEITYDLHFIEPFESFSQGYVKMAGEDGNVTASWGFFGEYPFPWNIMLLVVDMDEMMEKDFSRGLELLKNLCETEEGYVTKYEIKEIDYPATRYAIIRGTVQAAEMQTFFTEKYGAIGQAIGQKHARVMGPPVAIYYDVNMETWTFDMAAGMPVNKKVDTDEVETVEFSNGKVYAADYYGRYENMLPVYRAFEIFFIKNNSEMKMPSLEVYITDPRAEPDTSKWLTKVYFFAE